MDIVAQVPRGVPEWDQLQLCHFSHNRGAPKELHWLSSWSWPPSQIAFYTSDDFNFDYLTDYVDEVARFKSSRWLLMNMMLLSNTLLTFECQTYNLILWEIYREHDMFANVCFFLSELNLQIKLFLLKYTNIIIIIFSGPNSTTDHFEH